MSRIVQSIRGFDMTWNPGNILHRGLKIGTHFFWRGETTWHAVKKAKQMSYTLSKSQYWISNAIEPLDSYIYLVSNTFGNYS